MTIIAMREKITAYYYAPPLPFELEWLEGQTLPVKEIFIHK
jgi:hypothetical protein